ncbi:MAG: GerMN domain-containing protein [Chamaesiphon sp.]|nr:GerMN domain-containing protein [Chamaesiphon sp.]
MEDRKSISKSAVATISALTVSAVAIGSGLAWFTLHKNPPVATTPSTSPSPNPVAVDPAQVNPPTVASVPIVPNSTGVTPVPPSQLPTAVNTPKTQTIAQNQGTIKIWRLDDNGKKTFLVSQDRQDPEPKTSNPEVKLQRSMSTLLASAGKPDGKLTSTIPVGTKLLSSKILTDGIHIDLSQEFTQGFGATSMIGRLGQVIYTATAQNPDAPVWITVEGKKLEVLGDVGVEIRQPITRQTYSQDFPINPDPSTKP